MALLDSERREPAQAALDEGATNALPPVRLVDREVVQVAAAPVVAAEDGADERPLVPRDQAQPRVAAQVALDCVSAVGPAQRHPLRAPPERQRLVVVAHRELAD